MRDKCKILTLLCFLPFSVQAQSLINAGGTIIIENGATLVVAGSITNSGGGIIEVKENLDNTGGVINSGGTSILKFTGSAADQTVTFNEAVFNDIEMATTAQDVILADDMAIRGDINFSTDDNQIVLGANDLDLGDDATVTSPDANEYIVATGLGAVSKGFGTTSTFTYPVGGADYSPLAMDVGAVDAASWILINVRELAVPDLPPGAIDYIERYWNVCQFGFASFSASLDGTYVAGDIASGGSDVNNIKGASYNEISTEWIFDTAPASPLVASGDIDDDVLFTGSNCFFRCSD